MQIAQIIAKISEQLAEDDVLKIKLDTIAAMLEYVPSYQQEDAVKAVFGGEENAE